MADELIDAFDDELRPLGAHPRDEVHRNGWWHAVFHCLVVRTDRPARVLLQRRPRTARSFPGLLDLTATGHLLAGESPRDGVRELDEEVGLRADGDDLVALGTRQMADDAGEGRNRELVHAFLLPCDVPLEAFDLRDCDVDGLIEITAAGLRTVLAGGESGAVGLTRTGELGSIVVRPRDLVPPVDDYWMRLVDVAIRFVDDGGGGRGGPLSVE